MAKRTRKVAVSAEAKRMAREYSAMVKGIEVAHAAELDDRDKKHAELIARKDDRIAQMSGEQQALERQNAALTHQRDTALAQVKTMESEGNQLRGIIRTHENELARRAGYMEAIEDAKPKPPPRMIPAPEPEEYREAPRGSDGMLEFNDPRDESRYGGRARIRKGWWER